MDDEYDISLTIKVVLEENGFIVDSFTDASETLEILPLVYTIWLCLTLECQRWMDLDCMRRLKDKITICF